MEHIKFISYVFLELNKKKLEVESKMRKVLKHTASDLGLEPDKSIKLDFTEQHGYFLRVTLKEEHNLRKNKNYQIIDAVKGGVRFTNSKLQELNSTYEVLKNTYEESQKNVIKEIFEIAASYADTIRSLNFCIAKVDVLVSLATAAASAPVPYVRPKLINNEFRVLRLKRARHMCLERMDLMNFIPNDIELKEDETIFDIITGPNMGGKSTFMRTVGICVFLAHIGSFVPCDEAEISLTDCILARVGADDCELKGMSTFMLEMVETCGIVRVSIRYN